MPPVIPSVVEGQPQSRTAGGDPSTTLGMTGARAIAYEVRETSFGCRAALAALGDVTGAVATEAILDGIFARFCIGK